MSYADLSGGIEPLPEETWRAVKAGDIVQLGPNLGVNHEVIHIEGDVAWVRNCCLGFNLFAPRNRLRPAGA